MTGENFEIVSWRVEIVLEPYNIKPENGAQPKGIIEASLDKDWSGPEEDEAWKDL